MTSQLTAIGLDLDGSLARQCRLRQQLRLLADFTDISDPLRLRTDEPTARAAAGRLAELRRGLPGPLLTFIGSGDFHHIALLLLETLPDELRPFTLVLIDNHPDWFLESPKYHCGNWLSSALNLSGVEQVILIGQDSPDLVWYRFYRAPFDALCAGRLTIHPLRLRRRRVPLRWPVPPVSSPAESPSSAPAGEDTGGTFRRHRWGTELLFDSVRATPGLLDRLAKRLSGKNIYLSIDKDALLPEDAATDWEQGGLSLAELVEAVRKITAAGRLIGADICGERAPVPLRGLAKRLDAGRWFPRAADPARADPLNERANLALLEAFGIEEA
ncbi:MAG: arginase family protein [Tepidisphaerales bacterium]